MAQTKARDLEALIAVVHRAARGLSPRAVATLVAHLDAVRSALVVAADTLSARELPGDIEIVAGAEPRLVDPKQADQRITGRTRSGRTTDLLSSDDLARRAGVKTRQSVHDWLRKGRIIGWQAAKHGYVFPVSQLDDRDRPLKGLDRVVPLFEDAYTAWLWLTTPCPALDGATPLAFLRKGKVERVATAAAGDAQGDFA